MNRFVAATLFVVFLTVAVFGLAALLSHQGHHIGCPLMGASAVMCENTTIDHMSMWQALFALVLITVAFLLACIPVLPRMHAARVVQLPRRNEQLPPPLMQLLYCRGIHNRKDGCALSA